MVVDKILRDALEKHKSGDIDAAEALYQQILEYQPYDADVLNLLGVLALQRCNLGQAFALLQRAVEANPNIAEIHNNLGQVLMHQGRSRAAAVCFKNSLKINPNLEIARSNLKFATDDNPPIQSANAPPMKRYEVIQKVLNTQNACTYLEIGIDTGESFMNVRAPRKIGIDPVPTSNLINPMLDASDINHFRYSWSGNTGISELTLQAHSHSRFANLNSEETAELFFETSDIFFEKHAAKLFSLDPINVAFVDGLHTWEQTYRDVMNILNYLGRNGVILMHDCNPPSAAASYPADSWQAAAKMGLPGWNGQWCGDVWKAVIQLRTTRKDLNVFVLDCDFGIGVVSKGEPEGMLDFSASQIRAMTYSDLATDRAPLVNLKPPGYLYEFLQAIG
jgi:tetratricopeptide (TPR) repeat protein